MTKQIGRNPAAIEAMIMAGIDAGVCVDMNDARPVHHAGMKIGHLGHLVQVPAWETEAALKMHPMYWTVYNFEKAQAVSEAVQLPETQNIMTRIYGEGDSFYHGHEAGFCVDGILPAIIIASIAAGFLPICLVMANTFRPYFLPSSAIIFALWEITSRSRR
mgnify:CR=1 FL=1